jgi:putative flippase GtrA
MHFLFSKHIELFKYLLVGGLNTIFGYCVFAIFIFLGFHYSLAVLVSTILGVLFNFQSYGRLVFKNHSLSLLSRFIFVYTIIYFANIILILFFEKLVFNLYYSGALSIPFIAYLGFNLNKRYVWKKS